MQFLKGHFISMDNRPIGFFDSGLGGLTCMPYLMKALPKERVIYFGDTARTPYGSKAPSTIRLFSMQIADFLVKKNCKDVVSRATPSARFA
jgi:glutamate racemase